jgi:hypothetical protein
VRKRYEAAARRWENGWELHIRGLGVTQSAALADAEAMTRDYVSTLLGLPEDSFDVTVLPPAGGGMGEAGPDRVPVAGETIRQAWEEREINRLVNERMADPAPGVPLAVVLRETLDRAAD